MTVRPDQAIAALKQAAAAYDRALVANAHAKKEVDDGEPIRGRYQG